MAQQLQSAGIKIHADTQQGRPTHMLNPKGVPGATAMNLLNTFDGGYISGTAYKTQKDGSQEEGMAVQALRIFAMDEVLAANATWESGRRVRDNCESLEVPHAREVDRCDGCPFSKSMFRDDHSSWSDARVH